MADIRLCASPALPDTTLSLSDTTLTPVTLEIVSIALSTSVDAASLRWQDDVLRFPAIGWSINSDSGLSLLGLQSDLWFASCEQTVNSRLINELRPNPPDAIWLTEQSDAWACVDLDGELAVAALERCCMLDLTEQAYANGQVTRTRMEHLSVILLRRASQSFRLLSARSSAAHFWHMLSTSLQSVA